MSSSSVAEVVVAAAVAAEALVVGQLGPSHRRAQVDPLLLGDDDERDEASRSRGTRRTGTTAPPPCPLPFLIVTPSR